MGVLNARKRGLVGRVLRKREGSPANDQDSNLIGQSKALPYLMSAPAIFVICAILAFPVFYAIYYSLFRAEFLGAPQEWVGVRNYTELLTSADFLWSLGRSGLFVVGCLLVGIPLSLFFAFALSRAATRLRFFRGLSIAPYIVSSAAAAVMFRLLLNYDFGLINQILDLFGVTAVPWLREPTLAMASLIIAQLWTDIPLAILLLLGGLQGIDPSLNDAATVDGAEGWTRTRLISIPLIAPQLFLSIIWLSYGTLTSLGLVLALTKGGPGGATRTLPMEMYETAFLRLEMNQALALVVVILGLNAVLTLLYYVLSNRYNQDE